MPVVTIDQAHDVRIDRRSGNLGTAPGAWGNPFRIGPDGTRDEVIGAYRQLLWQYIRQGRVSLESLAALRGKRLACHCAPLPCHGHVLERAADYAFAQLHLRQGVLVCGSRDWTDTDAIARTLSTDAGLIDAGAIVYHGDARGADRMAADYLAEHRPDVTVVAMPADWERHGRSAGFKRNLAMLDRLVPERDLVIAFWRNGSRGTQHTLRNAAERDIPHLVVEAD